MNLTKGQLAIMAANGHLLVQGGPGSGKTTISILKASKIVEHELQSSQHILFLSFARATVSRVIEAIENEQSISTTTKRKISVETYHSFFWRILKTHGYLIGLPRHLSLLTPTDEAIILSDIRAEFPGRSLTEKQKLDKNNAELSERLRLAAEEGRICFDLFAAYVGDILHGSQRICRLLAVRYPVIVLDEFQDTNDAQWRVVQALGSCCNLIALADPEQRIFEWLGADPARLDHYRSAFEPSEIDLSTDNHRSVNTDIGIFGNDILSGNFRQSSYNGITCESYKPFQDMAMSKLVTTIYSARKRLIEQGIENWSLAILVPTKKMTRIVSDALRDPPAGMKEISHSAVIDMDATILGAEIVAHLMHPVFDDKHLEQFINLISNYFQGKNGDIPTKGALKEASNIRKAYDEMLAYKRKGKAIRKNSVIVNMLSTYNYVRSYTLEGIPDHDWHGIRNILERENCTRLQEIAREVRNLRLLGRGTQLRQLLSQDWRDNGGYHNALAITRQAFVQEHFSTNAKPESGVVIMNMHKAKGKQFDEVIIFEGWPRMKAGEIISNPDRIVRFNSKENIDDQACQNLRVSITRSKRHTTILTPNNDPCVLLLRRG